MKYNIYSIIAAGALMTGLAGCEKESNFVFGEDEGQLNTESLNVDYINSGRETRAGVNVGDFTVNFVNTATNEIAKSYKYSEMPEVVALPVGSYKAEAIYGDNPVAEWESPYYVGESSFIIEKGKITDNVGPVECELNNIRIKVNIDDLGLGLLGNDAKVVVEAGKDGNLTYDRTTTDKAGYFRYDGSNTIIATFSGTVDGVYVDNIKQMYDNANSGNAYTINFVVNKPDNVEPGDILIGDGTSDGITVDATISIQDQNEVIDPDEPDDNILVDDMRPVEDPTDPTNPDDPNVDPDNPNEPDDPNKEDPTPTDNKPQIVTISEGLILNQPCNVENLPHHKEIVDGEETEVYSCEFKVTSTSGIQEFKIFIDSSTLTQDTLEGVGLSANLDLVNPGDFADILSGFGFKVGAEVKDKNECSFDIGGFIPLLGMLGSGSHKFHLTVSDANGTTEGTIWINN